MENGCVLKARIADMNVYSPKRIFDFRISISTEIPGWFPAPVFFGPY